MCDKVLNEVLSAYIFDYVGWNDLPALTVSFVWLWLNMTVCEMNQLVNIHLFEMKNA